MSLATEEHEVQVAIGKMSLSMKFMEGSNEITTIFHAPWLWENRPANIHATSGQRLNSRSCSHGWEIASAKIIEHNYNQPPLKNNNEVSTNDEVNSHLSTAEASPLKQLSLSLPPRGCLHSIGTIYRTQQEEHKQNIAKKMLQITWQRKKEHGKKNGNQDRDNCVTSYYDLDWLRSWRYDANALVHRRQHTEIRKEDAISRNSDLIEMDYDQLINDNNPHTLLETLRAIVEDGAVLIKNAPLVSTGSNAPVAKVGRKLTGGSLSHGHLYGDLFHVKSIPDAHNVAYTPLPIPPHQDLTYYESKPGLQLLHCINNSCTGGESMLIDAMAAAHELRVIAPHYFNTLVQCRATFMKQREGGDMVSTRPHIVVGGRGDVVSVNWSPPFEGPAYDIPSDWIEPYYEANTAFELILDNSLPKRTELPKQLQQVEQELRSYANEYTWERRLQRGEILVFNNQRMLHGRRGFSLSSRANGRMNGGDHRHLVGCYTNAEETLNLYRLLMRDLNKKDDLFVVKNFGNGSSGTSVL